MNGIINENQLTIVKNYDFANPLIQKIDSIIDNCIRDCPNKDFHTFDHVCEYDLNFPNITTNETVSFTISDKNMGIYEMNQNLAFARESGFKFNQINKFNIKVLSNLTKIKIHYYLKFQIPMCHRLFFRRISQNRDYIQTHCNDRRNPFHFACRQWYLYNNPK